MSQLSLLLQDNFNGNLYKEEDFLLLPPNFAAVDFIKKFCTQNNFATASFTAMILKGETACGKSHLLNIIAQKSSLIEFIDHFTITQINLTDYFLANRFYILDDANEIKDEALLFHIINAAFENNSFLIIATKDNFDFRLKDLISRLKNIVAVEIKNPDLETIKHLLENYLSRKQIKLSKQITNLIANNIKRSYQSIAEAAKIIEFYINEQGKKLNIKEARNLFIK